MLLNTLVPCLLLASVCGEVQLRLGKMKVKLDADKPLVTVKICPKPLCSGHVILWYASDERDPTPDRNKGNKCRFRFDGDGARRNECTSVDIKEHGSSGTVTLFSECTPTVTDGKIEIEVAELPTQCNVTITNGIELENSKTEETSTTLIWALVAVGIAVALIIIVTVAVTVILCVRKKRRSTKGTTTTAPPKPALSLPPMAPMPNPAPTPPPQVRKPVPTPKLPPIPPLPAKKSEDGPRRKPWIEKPPSPPSPALMLSTTQRDDGGSARRGVIVTADPSTELDTRPISSCRTSRCTSNCSCQLDRPRTPPTDERRKPRGRDDKKQQKMLNGRIQKKKPKIRKSRSKSNWKDGKRCDGCDKEKNGDDPHRPSTENQGAVVRREQRPASLGTVPPFSQDSGPPVTASTQETITDTPPDNKVYDSFAPPENTQ